MKIILFFIAMIVCGINFADAALISDMTCTDDKGVSHTYKVDNNDLTVAYIDNVAYDYISNYTSGDNDITRYSNENNKQEVAYVAFELYDDGNNVERTNAKLILMNDGESTTTFSAPCKDN